MIKRIIIATVGILLLLAVSYGIHSNVITQIVSFSLLNVYVFFALSAILVYAVVELVFNYLPNQAGYAYLMLMFLKIGAFVLLFQADIFSEVDLSRADRISLVVPLFLFLMAEALAVVNLLKNK